MPTRPAKETRLSFLGYTLQVQVNGQHERVLLTFDSGCYQHGVTHPWQHMRLADAVFRDSHYSGQMKPSSIIPRNTHVPTIDRD
jgi:hypothetical protein